MDLERCNECQKYGDDHYYDIDGDYVCVCYSCPFFDQIESD